MGLRKWRAAAIAALAACLAGCGPGREGGQEVPGKEWKTKTPRSAGFSAKKLEEMAWKAGGAGCIVQGGRILFEWGDTRARNDVASSAKPIYTHLAYKAIESGRLESVQARAVDWLPELGGLNEALGYKDREITFHHLLSQTSGYGLEERPGDAFAYNDYGTGLLSWLLFHPVYGCKKGRDDEALNGEALGTAIGFEDGPTVLHRNSRPRRVRISVRDQARFILLYMRGGRWGEKRVLREDLAAEQMAFHLPADFPRASGRLAEHLEKVQTFGGGKDMKNHLGCLGYYWWFNHETSDGGRLLPGAPPGAFMGSGYGGRFAMVAIPELDLAAVWHDVYDGEEWSPFSEVGRFKVDELLGELLDARTGRGSE